MCELERCSLKNRGTDREPLAVGGSVGRRHPTRGNAQQVGLAFGEPLLCRRTLTLRAMPTAGVVCDHGMRAVLAARDMATERRRAAALDRTHHLQLAETDVTCIGLPPSRSMVAEDIRDLQGRTSHDRRGL